MALVLNTNSYVDILEADGYFETRIDSASWDAADDTLKEKALVTATTIIDERPWIGSAVSPSQALAWPRKNAIYYDTRLGQEIEFANDEVPERVKTAVYEQALHLIENEDLMLQTVKNYESISIGSISLTDSNNETTRISLTPSLAIKMIKPLISRSYNNSWWRAN